MKLKLLTLQNKLEKQEARNKSKGQKVQTKLNKGHKPQPNVSRIVSHAHCTPVVDEVLPVYHLYHHEKNIPLIPQYIIGYQSNPRRVPGKPYGPQIHHVKPQATIPRVIQPLRKNLPASAHRSIRNIGSQQWQIVRNVRKPKFLYNNSKPHNTRTTQPQRLNCGEPNHVSDQCAYDSPLACYKCVNLAK